MNLAQAVAMKVCTCTDSSFESNRCLSADVKAREHLLRSLSLLPLRFLFRSGQQHLAQHDPVHRPVHSLRSCRLLVLPSIVVDTHDSGLCPACLAVQRHRGEEEVEEVHRHWR